MTGHSVNKLQKVKDQIKIAKNHKAFYNNKDKIGSGDSNNTNTEKGHCTGSKGSGPIAPPLAGATGSTAGSSMV